MKVSKLKQIIKDSLNEIRANQLKEGEKEDAMDKIPCCVMGMVECCYKILTSQGKINPSSDTISTLREMEKYTINK